MLEPNINLLPKDLRSKEQFKSAPSKLATESVIRESAPAQVLKKKDGQQKEKKFAISKFKKKISGKKIEGLFTRFKAQIKKLTNSKKEQTPAPEKIGAELLTKEVLGPRSIRRELLSLGAIVTGFIFLFIGAYMYYEWRIQKIQTATAEAEDENANLDASISLAQKDLERSKQKADIVTTIEAILENRTDWNVILARMESLTLSAVYYTKFKSGGDGAIELTARAKTLEDALLQIQIFHNADNFIKSVDVREFSVTEEKIAPAGIENGESVTASFVEFPFSLTLRDDWFYAKTENN